MKTVHAAACLAFLLSFPLAGAAEKSPTDPAPLRVHLNGENEWIGIEPMSGSFRKVINGKDLEPQKTTFTIERGQPQAEMVAVFKTSGNDVKLASPLARYMITGLTPAAGAEIEVTLQLEGDQLKVTARDPQHRHRLTVKRMSEAEIAKASAFPVKRASKLAAIAPAGRNSPPAIGEAPSQTASAAAPTGKTLPSAVGLRSGEGTVIPFLDKGAVPKTIKPVYLHREFPGQTTADVTLFRGESQLVENDKKLDRYLVWGLSKNPKAMFVLNFDVTPSNKVVLRGASDSSLKSKNALKFEHYTQWRARQLAETFPGDGSPAPVAEAPIVAHYFH